MNNVLVSMMDAMTKDPDLEMDILQHYGTKKHSGRYPWGSGDRPYQHSSDFLARIDILKAQGRSEKEIIEDLKTLPGLDNFSSTDYRLALSLAKHERNELLRDRARSLQEDGKSYSEIAQIMGYANESSVRTLLNNKDAIDNRQVGKKTAEALKAELESKLKDDPLACLDISEGAEANYGVSRNKFEEALYILGMEGYAITGVGVKNVTNTKMQTNTMILANKGLTEKEAAKIGYSDGYSHIKLIGEYKYNQSDDTMQKLSYPQSLDSSRIFVRYGDQGGKDKDGVIEIRRGVKDLDMGNSMYAQGRILVDDEYYMKGMIVYSDDIPDGYDVIYNSNKPTGSKKNKVFKEITKDPSQPLNPFGATIKANGQTWYEDENGEKKLSVINKLKEESDWESQQVNLASQFLSKQPKKLLQQQLNLTYLDNKDQYDTIMSLENPTIKRKMLLDFADECESQVVTMKAMAFPRQSIQVLLPLDISDNEIYAPNYKNGEKVALVRYPHAGTFEIPVLTVNNNNPKGKANYGQLRDAVGISTKTAEKLSGADFDGDTAVVIPITSKSGIVSTPQLKQLDGWADDLRDIYATNFDKYRDELKAQGLEGKELDNATYKKLAKDDGISLIKTDQYKGNIMGVATNLITDMSIQDASTDEIARAVKYSMVTIDSKKHHLDYKKAYKDLGIAELQEKYQKHYNDEGDVIKTGGGSTLLTVTKREIEVPERKGSGWIDSEGKKHYSETGRTYIDKKGNVKEATSKSYLVLETEDLNDSSINSGTAIEKVYADYGNQMKALAQEARKSAIDPSMKLEYSPEAKKKYSAEVESLDAKIEEAKKNKGYEREAQRLANGTKYAIIQENPEITQTAEGRKKLSKNMAGEIQRRRDEVGAQSKNTKVKITDNEWEAIQSGAISDTKLAKLLTFVDNEDLYEKALPKSNNTISDAKQSKIRTMFEMGYTASEISEKMNVTTNQVWSTVKSEEKAG